MATFIKGNAIENATNYVLMEKKANGVYNSLAENNELNFELSTLGLAPGEHTLVVKAKAHFYENSNPSNEVVYTAIAGNLTVRIEFEDGVIPKGIGSIPLNFRFPNGKSCTPYVYKEDNYVIEFVGLTLGEYRIEELTEMLQAEGYNLTVTHMAYLEGEDPVEGNTITLTEENPNGYITIINRYDKIGMCDHEYSSVITEPTCTEQGYTTHACSVCGDSYVDTYVDALGHDWGNYVSQGDYHIRECKVCGEQEILGRLHVGIVFENDVIPKDVGSFAIDIISPDGNEETVHLDQYYSNAQFSRMALGQYIIRAQTNQVQADGYNLTVKYTVQRTGEDPVESQSVTITEDKPSATVTITYTYTKIN